MFNVLSFCTLLLLALSVDAAVHGGRHAHAHGRGRSDAISPRGGQSNDSPFVQKRTGQLARRAVKRCKVPPNSVSFSSSSAPPSSSPVPVTSKPTTTSTPHAANPTPPGNVGGKPSPDPTTSSSTSTSSSQGPIHTPKKPVPVDPSSSHSTPSSSVPTAKPGSGGGSGNGGLLSGVKSGQGTFYNTGLDACGGTDKDSDLIAAASFLLFDSFPGATANPNLNPICGKTVTASYGGKSVTVKIVDRCAGCNGEFDLDFSPSAFNALADPNLGRIDITWVWD